MCGITGIYRNNGELADRHALARMTRTLRHRGPDDSGVYLDGSLGLGHTRLSIIDLSALGRQPLCSDDGRFALVYNGEIYNFRDLRRTLEGLGHSFRGHSDTEVCLHACIEWGPDAFRRFEGMFALALWDKRERRLTLARDRPGIKPLYYCHASAGFVFGSEIKALLASGAIRPRIDWAGLHEFTHFGSTLGANTHFGGVRKLLPGHLLTLHAGEATVESFLPEPDGNLPRADVPAAARTVGSLLDRAVRDHLVSDVPVGVLLSGGIDSSAITAFASKHHPGRLRTFSAGFASDEGVNELPAARAVAEHFDTDHHELRVSSRNVTQVIERLVRSHDAPFADAASIPLYLLGEMLGSDTKVILQGDGGDEIFGGYRHYQLGPLETHLRLAGAATAWLSRFMRRSPRGGNAWARRFWRLQTLSQADRSEFLAALTSLNYLDAPLIRVFAPEARSMLRSSDPFARYRACFEQLKGLDPVQRMLHTDYRTWLPDRYLEKVDRATMAHGIEARVPFLDKRLAAYAMGLPSRFKVRARDKKYILRAALRGLVPDFVLDSPKKGFAVPVEHWLRTSLSGYLRSVLLDDSVANSGLFDRSMLERLIDEHLSEREEHGLFLYELLCLALWYTSYRPIA